jgi:hypothetical protein
LTPILEPLTLIKNPNFKVKISSFFNTSSSSQSVFYCKFFLHNTTCCWWKESLLILDKSNYTNRGIVDSTLSPMIHNFHRDILPPIPHNGSNLQGCPDHNSHLHTHSSQSTAPAVNSALQKLIKCN